jgi:hypothetical protein
MAAKNETSFVNYFRDNVLKRYNCAYMSVHGHMMQTTSWPDYYVAHSLVGQFWIEFKVWPNKCDVKQEQRIEELRSKNVPVIVITLFTDVEKAPQWCFQHDHRSSDGGRHSKFIVLKCEEMGNEIIDFDRETNCCKVWELILEMIDVFLDNRGICNERLHSVVQKLDSTGIGSW